MPSDDQLLLRYAREGDVESLSALVSNNARWLMAYLRGLSPNDADAEDAFQEAWLRVIRSCGSYRGGSVRAYLVQVARSVAVDRFRRKGSVPVSLDSADEDGQASVGAVADEAPLPNATFEFRATAEEVRRAVRRLPERQREVLLMRIEGELTFREIAEQMGVPLGTALTWMRTATERLKGMLGGQK